jgi:leucyl/phenylalanyl-tRNA--protein transferase
VTWSWPFRRGSNDRDVPWIPPELGEAEGLVGIGGELTPQTLIKAYADGVFPWYSDGDPYLWWSPDPRAIIELDELHISHRLARTIRSGKFRVTINRCFEQVMRACGENRPEGTWVTDEMVAAYTGLHRLGHAHSLEVWAREPNPPAPLPKREGGAKAQPASFSPPLLGEEPGEGLSSGEGFTLAGGIYGVSVGGLFSGESMFHRKTDASKVALAALVDRLRQRGYLLFDVQMTTDHTERLGAKNISRAEYLERLREAVAKTGAQFS